MRKARIGAAVFDPDTHIMLCPDGKQCQLRRQSVRVLERLLEKPGSIQTKKELLNAVWGNLVVTEDSLIQCVADIRRALGRSRVHLQTVPRVGYRLIYDELDIGKQTKGDDVRDANNPIRYANAPDGVKLAWTSSGEGLPLLKAPSWISNIEMENRSQIFSPLYERLSSRSKLVRFDQRGTSLSGRVSGVLSVDHMVDDILVVADAAGLDQFVLYGPSQGMAFSIAFAHRYPNRVLGIIGRGGFAKGWLATGCEIQKQKYDVSRALIEAGWNTPNPEYRRFFTGRLIPNASGELAAEFDEMQKNAVDTASMLANLELMGTLDVEAEARAIDCPVLLLHSRGDRAVDITEGNRLAAMISNAEFCILDDDNHIFLPATRGFEQALSAMEQFLEKFQVNQE